MSNHPIGTAPAVEEDAELKALSIEKLRLEIRNLSTPWWRTPSNLGPIATIAGAALALVWAVTSGFFDISRRELDVRRSEVKNELNMIEERRDAQSKLFKAEVTSQQTRITALLSETSEQRKLRGRLEGSLQALDRRYRDEAQQLEVREGRLREVILDLSKNRRIISDLRRQTDFFKKRLDLLDQPILTGAQEIGHHDETAIIRLFGYNFGARRGKAYIVLSNPSLFCEGDESHLKCENSTLTEKVESNVVGWTTEYIEIQASRVAVQASLERLRKSKASRFDPDLRVFQVEGTIERDDRKNSNAVAIAQLQTWVTKD